MIIAQAAQFIVEQSLGRAYTVAANKNAPCAARTGPFHKRAIPLPKNSAEGTARLGGWNAQKSGEAMQQAHAWLPVQFSWRLIRVLVHGITFALLPS